MPDITRKILITIPWFYPAFRAGGPVQSIVSLVNNYKKCSYFIVCGNTDLNDVPLNVETGKWISYNNNTQVYYLPRAKRSDTITKLCDSVQPDVLMAVGMYSWHFTIVPLWFCKAKKKILSVRGMLHTGALGQKRLKKKAFFTLWKLLGLQHKAHFHATDAIEKNMILNFFDEDDLPVFIAGNYPRIFQKQPVTRKEEGHIILATVALISPMKNILKVLEALKLCVSEIQYHIYGPVKDSSYWNECKELIVTLPVNIKVQYHGELAPDDVERTLQSSHVFILPSESENFGHAHLEALSAGRPLISSTGIPWLNLKERKAGLNLKIDPQDIMRGVEFFSAMSHEELLEWSEGAAKYSRECINFADLQSQYDHLFEITDIN